jgi:hypothetical protein
LPPSLQLPARRRAPLPARQARQAPLPARQARWVALPARQAAPRRLLVRRGPGAPQDPLLGAPPASEPPHLQGAEKRQARREAAARTGDLRPAAPYSPCWHRRPASEARFWTGAVHRPCRPRPPVHAPNVSSSRPPEHGTAGACMCCIRGAGNRRAAAHLLVPRAAVDDVLGLLADARDHQKARVARGGRELRKRAPLSRLR